MQLNLATLHIPALMMTTFLTLLALIALDTVLGMVQAIIKGTWKWNQVGHFLETSVLPYVGGVMALAFMALIKTTKLKAYYTAAAEATLKLIADIVIKIGQFGIQVPNETVPGTTVPPATN